MFSEHDDRSAHRDLLVVLRSRFQSLRRVVARYEDIDTLDLSERERARVAAAIDAIEAALDQLW